MSEIVSAFSAAQVERLTGLSATQLRDWDADGFFSPTFAAENRRSPYSRIYSFNDLVGLRTLSILRKKHSIPLPELKRTAAKLEKHSGQPWSDLTLFVLNREVHFRHPTTGDVEGALSGQFAAPIALGSIADDLRTSIQDARKRSKTSQDEVVQHRFIAHNRKVVAGTRIPIESIQAFADAGYSVARIMDQYPTLTRVEIEGALSNSKNRADAA